MSYSCSRSLPIASIGAFVNTELLLRARADEVKDVSYRAAVVVDRDRRPIGLVTRADLVGGLQKFGAAVPVGRVVSRAQDAADPGEPLELAIQRFLATGQDADSV